VLPSDHPFQRFLDYQEYFLSTTDDRTEWEHLLWGLNSDALDLNGVNLLFDKEKRGTPIYETTFTFDAAAQEHILNACAVLRDSPEVTRVPDALTAKTRAVIRCFMEEWRDDREYNGLAWPVTDAAAAETDLWAWSRFETPWNHGGYSRAPTSIFRFEWQEDIKRYQGKFYVKVRAESKIPYYGFLSADRANDLFNAWENVSATVNEMAPSSAAFSTQLCGERIGMRNRWVFKDMQDMYVRVAMQGVLIGSVVAFVVLWAATLNLLVALLAIFTIEMAIMCVVGTTVAMGWTLGSYESQFIMILSGFSVDYVVHLAHAYMESLAKLRIDRVHDGVRALGISVFWGMATSAIACVSLTLCQIQFFFKFGLFFLLTILWAYLWSSLFMLSVLAWVGPEPRKGNEGINSRVMA